MRRFRLGEVRQPQSMQRVVFLVILLLYISG